MSRQPAPVQSRTWHGEVPQAPPSANVFQRMHWIDRRKLIADWYILLCAAFFRETPTQATGRRRVRVVVRSKQERDYANLWLAVDKLVFDNLTKRGWLVDDDRAHLEPEVLGEEGTPRTLIEISEAAPERGT